MRERLQRRLEALNAEYEAGQAQLRDLEATLLRISGAILVLQELLAEDEPQAPNGPTAPEEVPAGGRAEPVGS